MIVNAIAASATLTADGTAAGVVTVADTTPFFAGALATLRNDAGAAEVVITRIISATTMSVKKVAAGSQLNYGHSDVSAYTLVTNSLIVMPAQTLVGDSDATLKHLTYWNGNV